MLADDDLSRVFMDRPVFSEEQVARIVAAAVLPGTWHRSPAESTVGDHITREFEALEEAVGPHLARAYTAPRMTSTRTVGGRTRRPTAVRRPSSRKRQSALEKLFRSLLLPAVGLIVFWIYMNSITGK